MDVIGITRSEWKRDLALELGAVAVADPSEAAEVVLSHTDGRGADLRVEAAGFEATLADAISLTGIGGEILSYGTVVTAGKGLPYYDLYFKDSPSTTPARRSTPTMSAESHSPLQGW